MALQGIQAAELSNNFNIGEIFGVARFSTFSTVSAINCLANQLAG